MPKKLSKDDAKVLPIELIFRHTISEGFTQSEFSDMSCMQRWNYRYNQLLIKPGIIAFPLRVGSAFHDAMEQFYATKGMRVHVAPLQFQEYEIPGLTDIEKKVYWDAVIPAMVEGYANEYKADPVKWKIEAIEIELDVVYRGFRLRGKVDLKILQKNGRWIVDHKTMSRLNRDVVAGWDFRFQFMFYIWLLSLVNTEKVNGYIVNGVKKPELRVKQSESIPSFAARVKEDMIINPDKYFYREEYPINQSQLLHFQTEVVDPKIEKLKFIIENPTTPIAQALMKEKNTDECQKWGGAPCAYIDLCQHGFDKMAFLYRTKPKKHEELIEGDEA